MNVAVKHILGVGQNCSGVVCQNDLSLGAAVLNQLGVVLDIVNTGERMLNVAEQLTELGGGQHITVRVDALRVDTVQIDQMVADLVGGVAEHQNNLLAALGNAPQANGKAVAAENGEDHANGTTAELCAHISGNIICCAVVALRTCNNGFGHGDNIPVMGSQAILFDGIQDRTGNDLGQIIALTDNRSANTHRNST